MLIYARKRQSFVCPQSSVSGEVFSFFGLDMHLSKGFAMFHGD